MRWSPGSEYIVIAWSSPYKTVNSTNRFQHSFLIITLIPRSVLKNFLFPDGDPRFFYRVVVVKARVDRFLVARGEPLVRVDVVDVGVLLVGNEIPFDDGPAKEQLDSDLGRFGHSNLIYGFNFCLRS